MRKLLPFIVLIIVASCQKGVINDLNVNPIANSTCDSCNVKITKDSNRLKVYNQTINLEQEQSKAGRIAGSKTADTLALTLKAILNPLTINYNGKDILLNANHVSVKSNRVAASYSIVGEPYGGAVDIIDIPKNKNVSLEGTLLMPNEDIDAVDFDGRTRLLFGGGLNVDLFPEASSSSFFEYYSLNSITKNTKEFNLKKLKEYTSRFGFKLNSIKAMSGYVFGSGGGPGGKVFMFNKKTKNVSLDESFNTSGLFIFDTTIAKDGNKKYIVAFAYDQGLQEVKALYYSILSKDQIQFSYEVNLGNFKLNVEAKHTIISPKKNVLIVSLEQEGIGVFKVQEKNGTHTATLHQQLKSKILNPSNPDETINSFSYNRGVFYVAAGAGGVLIMPYKSKIQTLLYAYKVPVPGESVNSTSRSDDNLVVASTSGVRILKVRKN